MKAANLRENWQLYSDANSAAESSTGAAAVTWLQTMKARVWVPCSTKDLGKAVMSVCQVGCIGCKMCVLACPYEARYFNAEKHAIDKCNFCWDTRLSKGKKLTACSSVCPSGARIFGDISDPENVVKISELALGDTTELDPYSIEIQDNYAFLGFDGAGLAVVDGPGGLRGGCQTIRIDHFSRYVN